MYWCACNRIKWIWLVNMPKRHWRWRDQSRRTQGALAEARDSLIQAKTPEQIKQARMQLGLAQAAERDQQLAWHVPNWHSRQLDRRLGLYPVAAPFAGMVSDIYARVGDKVSPAFTVDQPGRCSQPARAVSFR